MARSSRRALVGQLAILLLAGGRVSGAPAERALHEERQGQSDRRGHLPREGLARFLGQWFLYYGTADGRLAVASAPLR
jgi:hypothetical protein